MPINQKLLASIQYNDFKEQTLSLNKKELTDEDIFLLVKVLKHNSYITNLHLKFNFISSLGAQILATVFFLEKLDVSENNIGPEGAIALAKSHFKTLDISNNPIGEGIIAFASSPLLVELTAANCSHFTDEGIKQLLLSQSLKKLILSNNGLSGQCLEDIASNTTLEWLDLSKNQVKGEYCSHIKQNNTLKILTLCDNPIGNEGTILLAENRTLREINLTQCLIGDQGALSLSQSDSLRFLELSKNNITEKGVRALVNNTTFRSLTLKDNPFDFSDVIKLDKYYKSTEEKVYERTVRERLFIDIQYNHFKERTLSLNNQKLIDEDIFLLVETLRYNTYIKNIDLKNNFLSLLGAKSLTTLTHLESLDVSGNNIGPEEAIALAKSNFKIINLSNNPIGKGITAFAESPLLVELNASNCLNFTDAQVKPLFSSQSLKKLILSNNELSGQCLKNIASNTTLEWLDLSQNKVKGKYCRYITQMNALKTLNLSDNVIKSEGTMLLAHSRSLKDVLLARCFIEDEGVDALSKNGFFESLELSGNQITEKVANAFAHSFMLLRLNLKDNPGNFSNVESLKKHFKSEEKHVYTRGEWERLLFIIQYNHFKEQALDLDYKVLTEQNIILLVKALKYNSYIKSLKLQTNFVSLLAAQSLATLIHSESLDVSENHIGPNEAIALAKSHFKTINISGNPIGKGIIAFAANSLLIELNASNCSNFTDVEVKQLLLSQSLKKLILSNNGLSGQCLKYLTFNTTLKWLDLSQNKIKGEYCRYITQINTLETLNLSDNPIKNEGATLLAHSYSLKDVLLERCFIGDTGADALSKNAVLEFLGLSGNQITKKGANALANSIKLSYLNLKDNPGNFSEATDLNKHFKSEEKNVYTRGEWERLLTAIQYNYFKNQVLDLNYQELTEQNIIVLVEALKVNNYINSLKLQTTLISSLAAQNLATLTHLEFLNVSGNNIGPDGAIALAKNHFKIINISSNPIGEGITAFAKSSLLVELNASNCSNFTDAEVKPLFSSQSLNKLILSNNGLSGECLENITSNNTLKWLDLAQNAIEAKYCHHIAQNYTLKILNLSNNFIGDEGTILLAKNHSLTDLLLTQCLIGDEGAIALSQTGYFQLSNDRFKFLGISDNKITEKGARALANNFTFRYLNLRGNPFNPLDVIELGKFYSSKEEKVYTRTEWERTLAAIQSNHLKGYTLFLNNNNLTDKSIISLVEALTHNNHVKELNLENNFISSLGAQSLATLMNLALLNVSGNNIGIDGAIALAKSHLRELDISRNPIGKGIAAFAESPLLVALTVTHCPNLTDNKVKRIFLNSSLEKLDLSSNGLSGQCLEGIISNTTLEWLNLSQNKLEGKYCYHIAQNNTLKTLNLSANVIQDEGAILLARNSALSLLNLTNCSIGDQGAFALSKNSHFKELVLDNNKITEQGANALASNFTLSTLSLQCNPFELLDIINVNENYPSKKEKAHAKTEDIETLLKKALDSNLAQELLILNRIQRNHFKESTLCLEYRNLTEKDMIILAEVLKHNHYIKKLHLELNSISSQGAQILATLTHLETLNVEQNNIGPEGAIALAKSHFKTINISGNPIGDSIAAFSACSSLTRLEVNECEHITDAGVEQLLLSKSIKELNLAFSQITSKCLKALASNTVLKGLDLSLTKIKEKDCCDYIAQNNSLEWVNLCYLPIEDEGAIALAKSRSLKALFLTNCSIADQGAVALSKNSYLEKLSLEENAITEKGANALANNITLTHLNLTGNLFNHLNVTDLEKFYTRNYEEFYTRTKEDIEVLLKQRVTLKLDSNESESFSTDAKHAKI